MTSLFATQTNAFDITASAGLDGRFIIEKKDEIGRGKLHIYTLSSEVRYQCLSGQVHFEYDDKTEDTDTQFFINFTAPLRKFRFSVGTGVSVDDKRVMEKFDVNYDLNGVILGVYGTFKTEYMVDKKNWTELMNVSEIYKSTFGIYGGYRFFDAYKHRNIEQTKADRNPLSLYLGTSYMYSHLGFALDVNNWELGSKLYISYPNLYLYRRDQIRYTGFDTGNNRADRTYAGVTTMGFDVNALYKVFDYKHFELVAGPALFIYQFHGDYIDVPMRTMNVNLMLDAKATVWMGKFGIYLESGIPVFAMSCMDKDDAQYPSLRQLAKYDGFCLKYMSRLGFAVKF